MSREDPHFRLRLPADLKAELEAEATASSKSITAVIVARLRAKEDLRDRFAGQALSGILAGGFACTIPHDDVNGGGDAAFFAYQYADAMLKVRGESQ